MTGTMAPGSNDRFYELLNEKKARIASGARCSTAGYDPSTLLAREGASARDIKKHMSTMPAFLKEEQAHVTGSGRNGELLTFCRKGRLESMVYED
jgi:hypothetical protein